MRNATRAAGGWCNIAFALAALVSCADRAAAADDAPYRAAPTPDWVIPVDAGHDAERDLGAHGATFHHLVDSQVDVRGGGNHQYQRHVIEALSQAGVESVGSIQITFDPSYEQLLLHSLVVHRGRQRLDKLSSTRVELLQRERALEEQIYDGRRTASLFLDDVRVGDVVEYAYSRVGRNPVFGGFSHGTLRRAWSAPAGRVFTRLVVDAGAEPSVVTRNESLDPVRTVDGSMVEYVWDASDVAALDAEGSTPGWYFPWAHVEWSGHADWNSVARWATPLYAVPQPLDPDVRRIAEGIAASHASPAQRLLASLRFVQSEIRYLGVEVGVGSHAPRAPGEVLARRFGDCKDKTVLLLSLLGELGVPASAALVFTGRLRAEDASLPSPAAFDHVMVVAEIEGTRYWVDPTLPAQGSGTLGGLWQPDYGLALRVRADSRGLESMHANPHLVEDQSIHVVLDARQGIDEEASYTVTTTHRGSSADDARNEWADIGSTELAERFLRFYATFYPDIRRLAPLEHVDEPALNRFSITERYAIPNAWKRVDSASRHELDIGIHDLVERMPSVSPRRTAPLSLRGPIDVTQVTEVHLHEPWPLESGRKQIAHAAFTFDRDTEVEGNSIRFTDRLRIHVPHVASGQLPSFAERLDAFNTEVSDVLYYEDTAPTSPAPGTNWTLIIATLLAMTVGIVASLRLYRWDPAAPRTSGDPKLAGIGGWLILPAIGVVLGPPVAAIMVWATMHNVDAASWQALTTPGSNEYHALWAPVLLFELMGATLLGALSALLLVLFFKRRRSTPAVYIGVSIAAVLHELGSVIFLHALPVEAGDRMQGIGSLAGSALVTLLWCGYFLQSGRVEATFTRGWRQRRPDDTATDGASAVRLGDPVETTPQLLPPAAPVPAEA